MEFLISTTDLDNILYSICQEMLAEAFLVQEFQSLYYVILEPIITKMSFKALTLELRTHCEVKS